MTDPNEDRLARLQAQVVDLSEAVLTQSGKIMALEVVTTHAVLTPDERLAAGIDVSTAQLLERVYASLLTTSVGAQFLEGFHETAETIRTARDVLQAVTGKG
jgi:hypothetical protein